MYSFAPKQRTAQPADTAKSAGRSIRVQPTLAVNAPGDAYEQEADRVAAQVMRKPASSSPVNTRRTQSNDFGEAAPQPAVDEALRSSGQPLDSATRAFFEPRFGYNLGSVRVHADARASGAARAVNARAFTVGQDMVFGQGQYAPGTSEGRHLLAHELTHTVQQGAVGPGNGRAMAGGTIQRQAAPAPRRAIWVNVGFDSSAQANEVTMAKLRASIAREQAAITSCCSAHSLACNIDVKTRYDWNRVNKPAPADHDYDDDDANDRTLRDRNLDNITGHAGGLKVLVTECTLSQTWQGGRIFPRANTGAHGVLWNRSLAADDTIAHESGHAAGYRGDSEGGSHSSDPHNLMSPGSVRTADAAPDTNWCTQMAGTAQ
ncbi:MAG TPA: DUF4157 domain-containing protein [Opitutaceae bacterium]|jgi:hypothetical protein|nr:DUF4157 domain-containing protein [Opitutaceae bacterium]